jgi:hypothetical protein
MSELTRKYEEARQKYMANQDKMIPVFFRNKLHYVWNAMNGGEIELVASDTIYSGTFVELGKATWDLLSSAQNQVEIIPSDEDIIMLEVDDQDYTKEELLDVVDQILRNTPHDWKFVHINWHRPKTDASSGESLYIVSLEDALDDQRPYDEKEEFEDE